MKNLIKNFEIIFLFLLFVIIFVFKYSILNLPYSWDVMNYIIPAANYIYENGFTIFLWEYSNGHPPFYFILLGFIFKIFWNSQIVAHTVNVVFSFLAVVFTYLLGKHLFSRKVGIIAAFLMFFYPTFFSYSGMSYLAIPLTALTVISIYCFVKNKILFYLVFSSLLVLTKETGIFVPAALLFYDILKNKKIYLKRYIILVVPLFIFALWLLSNKFHYGSFVYPLNATLFTPSFLILFFNLFIVLKSLFFDYFKWILTSFIIICCFSFKLIEKNKKRLFYFFILSFFLFVLLFNLPRLSFYFKEYFPNILNYFLILKEFSILFALLFFVFLLSFKKFIKFWSNKKLFPFYIVFIFMFISYILFTPFPARYGLPIYPIIFLFFSISLVKIFKRYSYAILLLLLILFVTQWTGNRTEVGFALENNMEYVDMIKTHKMATNYLENNFPNSTILVSYPQSLELKYSYLGYVKEPLNIVSIPPYPGLITKNSTIYLNPSNYSKKIDLNSIDILYYSDQEYKTKYSRELNKVLNKTLIKRFELNGKVAEIYKINKGDYPNYTLPLD